MRYFRCRIFKYAHTPSCRKIKSTGGKQFCDHGTGTDVHFAARVVVWKHAIEGINFEGQNGIGTEVEDGPADYGLSTAVTIFIIVWWPIVIIRMWLAGILRIYR